MLSDLSSVSELRYVAPHKPAAMCASRAGDTLFYVDANRKLREIRRMECG